MSIWIDGIEIIMSGKLFRFANVAPECYGMINDPDILINNIKKHGYSFDILTFGQRLPNIEPKYPYYQEWDEIAVLNITTYENWLNKQIIKENKKNIAKAAKRGIIVREVEFSDDLVNGIIDIYNESPVRQGKKFWHYNKDFDTVKSENGTYLDRCVFIGAFYEDRIIGFVKIVITEGCASTLQVISKIEHRDKKPTNALLAKTVEFCASRNIPYLQYGVWSGGTLGDFKSQNGFQKMLVPRYFIPITLRGRSCLSMQLHQGINKIMPYKVLNELKGIRKKWYELTMNKQA